MRILDIFKSKDNEQISNLTDTFEELKNSIEQASTFDAMPAVVGNSVQYWDTSSNKVDIDSHPMLYRAIDLLAGTLAKLPVLLYKGDKLLDENFRFMYNGHLFNIWEPNFNMSFNELFYTANLYFFFTGEWMVYINTAEGLTLEPIDPRKMRVRDGVWEQTLPEGKKRIILPSELIYCKMPTIGEGRASSPIDALRDDLITYMEAQKFNKALFKNYGQLGNILVDTVGNKPVSVMQQLKDSFDAAHAGSDKAGVTGALTGGIDVRNTTQTMNELQFSNTLTEIRDNILYCLGVPKGLAGVTDDINYATAREETRQLWFFNLIDKALRIQGKINRILMRQYFTSEGVKVVFDFGALQELGRDEETKMTLSKQYLELGYTTNETNNLLDLGMEEITDGEGDIRYAPNDLTPIAELMLEPEDTPAPSGGDASISTLFTASSMTKKQNNYVKSFDRVQRKHEKKFKSKVGGIFSKQRGKVLAILNSDSSDNVDIILKLSAIRTYLSEDKDNVKAKLTPLYEQTTVDADALAIGTLNSSVEPMISKEVVDSMANRITGINDTTYNDIKNTVMKGANEGETMAQISDRIRKVFKTSKKRATIIAQTETMAAVNETTYNRYKKENVQKKIWLGTNDAVIRPSHAAVNGEIVGINEMFSIGMSAPGDSRGGAAEVVNCRCVLAPVISVD